MEIIKPICPRCLNEIIWMNDYMSSELSDEFAQNDASVTSTYHCPYCGATIELIDPSDVDKHEYLYWNDKI